MRISVKVRPNAKQQRVEQIAQNSFLVWVKEKPVEGKANQAVVRILAQYFGIPQSSVNLLKGQNSKQKLFDILI
ncbi:MAG: DUF167 domain-containing protein [Candidatus Omnitrophica bacterium]|nr:DUF167 domain-containing protein [Candidatus Omnitrophota bacterium]MCM8771119.1 DUF167 domain-containing protein [Candidatus Omnitrophota bacterium]